jgi:Ca-activated chloride channel family protein
MFTRRYLTRIALFGLIAALVLSACGGKSDKRPADAVTLKWVYSTTLQDWASASITSFNHEKVKASDGRVIWIEGVSADAGQAVSDMLGGAALPVLWTAADPGWRNVLHEKAGTEVFAPNCISIAESPLVIAMWEPIARALGWPGRALGWLDVASLAADPSGWAYYSGGEWGTTLRIGHSHPGLSDSGTQTLQALIYAAQSSPDRITTDDAQNPIVQASVGAFESAVSWFSPDTRLLSSTIQERGITYLNAAILYENAVVTQTSYSPRLIAIYPYEGTFVATFPTCVRAGMDQVTTGAAETFLSYLIDTPAQQRALQYGLRPVKDTVPVGAPIDPAHGADPAQPGHIFAFTDADVIFAIQDLWQNQRRNVNLVMVLDTSGSMDGQKIDQVKQSAIEFVKRLGDNDRLTVIAFNERPNILLPAQKAGGHREQMIAAIESLQAGGNTALFDTIAFASELMAQTGHSDEVNALVVLTDGQDTASQQYSSADQAFGAVVQQSGGSVYSVAYGKDADLKTMRSIALATNGIFYQGDVSTIGDIYAEMSAAFGGSLGVGR